MEDRLRCEFDFAPGDKALVEVEVMGLELNQRGAWYRIRCPLFSSQVWSVAPSKLLALVSDNEEGADVVNE